jgi:hypothetical protein
MKKTLSLAAMSVVIVMLSVGSGYAQPMGPGIMGPGYGYGENWDYCPYCGNYVGPGYGMGPGMMGGGYGGYGMGPGRMGQGYGYGYGMGPGMMGGGYGGYGMGPWMMGRGYGGYGMGPGMMGGGYGMMGPGYGYGPQYGYRQQYQQLQKPLDKDQAKQQVENYLKSSRNPNLSVGRVEEKGTHYEVDIQTKDGSLADKILVDKNTGGMRSLY